MGYYKIEAEAVVESTAEEHAETAKLVDPVIASTDVGGVLVETFFIGFDHSTVRKDDEKPQLWRTRTVGAATSDKWPKQTRYTSEADALAGHDEFVAALAELGQAEIDKGK